MVGGLAVEFFKDRFRQQGWRDEGFEPWEGRRTPDKNTRRRSILTKTGRLKRSPRVIFKSKYKVFVGTDVPYAQPHNEGFEGQVQQSVRGHRVREHARRGRTPTVVKAHERKAHRRTVDMSIPKRQFMGDSQFFNRRAEMNIEHELRKELRFLKHI